MNALSPQNEILHITNSAVIGGSIRFVIREIKQKGDIAIFPLNISYCAVPKSLNADEIERCIKQEYVSYANEDIRNFAQIQFDKYKKIVVWHTKDSASLLLMYFICHILPNNNLYHIPIHNCGNLESHIAAYKNCKKLTVHQYAKFQRIYSNLLETDGFPKIAKGWQIVLTDKERWKKHILKQVNKQPRFLNRVIGESIRTQPMTCSFRDDFYLALMILELIEEKKIIPVEIETKPDQIIEEAIKSGRFQSAKEYKKLNHPILKVGDFHNLGKSHIYNGVDLCKCYRFKLVKGLKTDKGKIEDVRKLDNIYIDRQYEK